MASLMPRFSAARMVGEYLNNFYQPASKQGERYTRDHFAGAREMADWKNRIKNAWSGVQIRRIDTPMNRANFNDALNFKVAARLNGLRPEDVVVELLIRRQYKKTQLSKFNHFSFEFKGTQAHDEHIFELKLAPELCGKQEYYIRIYPHNSLLTHPLEMGMMVWV